MESVLFTQCIYIYMCVYKPGQSVVHEKPKSSFMSRPIPYVSFSEWLSVAYLYLLWEWLLT